eukprot:m.311383 g.311383  ORF g.311383 m.311383 type:complete len:218 (+) comp27453_c0_seq1:2-655(+)
MSTLAAAAAARRAVKHAQLRLLAEHDRWATRRLVEALRQLSPAQYTEDAGLAVASAHATLCHIWLAHELWYSRITNSPTISFQRSAAAPLEHWTRDEVGAFWQPAAGDENFQRFGRALANLDEAAFALDAVSTKWLEFIDEQYGPAGSSGRSDVNNDMFSYSNTRGDRMEKPRYETLQHVFLHPVHHRGQISVVITRALGQAAAPVMDLLYFLSADS